jgi:hypothetical protein
VNKFAADHLEVDDRDEYVAGMAGRGIPARDFEKDVSLIQGKIGRVRLETRNGVMVLAPPGTLDDGTVTICGNEDETSTVTVRDYVEKMFSSGRVNKAPES